MLKPVRRGGAGAGCGGGCCGVLETIKKNVKY